MEESLAPTRQRIVLPPFVGMLVCIAAPADAVWPADGTAIALIIGNAPTVP